MYVIQDLKSKIFHNLCAAIVRLLNADILILALYIGCVRFALVFLMYFAILRKVYFLILSKIYLSNIVDY